MNLVIEMMSNEQLDQVSGGTCQQTDELIRAIGPVDVRVKGGHTHYQTTYRTEHRQLKRDEVEDYLKKHYGIDADISNGFLFFSDGSNNTYKKNGQSLTHEQVWYMIVQKI